MLTCQAQTGLPFPATNGEQRDEVKCVSLATGMKCLAHAKVQTARGNVLHDSHAEILALRGFNRWLVDECEELARKGFMSGMEGEEGWVRWRQRTVHGRDEKRQEERQEPPFELHEDVSLHMYCSEAPCGDASMELVMQEQEDDTPWDRAPPTPALETDPQDEETLLGRGYFDQLGIVRRKPARPDAPLTLSKSCSDKLAMKQCTGLLSSVTARLVERRGTWLSTLVLPRSRLVEGAMERAFGRTGRMAPLLADEAILSRWRDKGFAFQPFEVRGTEREFGFSKIRSSTASQASAVPSNLATICTPQRSEILINGVLQGRRQDDPRGASCVSRRRMWEATRGLERLLYPEANQAPEAVEDETYTDFKACTHREMVKADVRRLALKGWKRNEGDEGWRLDERSL